MYINLQLRTDVLASYDLEQIEGTIGNSKNACIILKSKTVHSEHAKLTRVKKGVIITSCFICLGSIEKSFWKVFIVGSIRSRDYLRRVYLHIQIAEDNDLFFDAYEICLLFWCMHQQLLSLMQGCRWKQKFLSHLK